MRMPSDTAHYSQHVRYGRYVSRRLRRAGYEVPAADVAKITKSLLAAGRAWEDSDEAVQNALADRDGADDDLDEGAKNARAALAGRSADAVKQPPFTLIFYKGLLYYTAALIGEEIERYTEFKRRLEENLSEKDEVRVKTVKIVTAGLVDFTKASHELSVARSDESLAGTRLQSAIGAWERMIEKTYGGLVSELGREQAEKFFPKARAKKSEDANNGSEGSGGTGG